MMVIYKICIKINRKILYMTNEFSKEVVLKKLGKRIKEIRIAKGYTSYEYFAYEHNISRTK